MVELHVSLRCSEYLASTATFRVQTGVPILLLHIVRLLGRS
jgi:hypothetical protein